MTQIKVGIFLFFGLAVLFITIFMLGSNKSLFQEVVEVRSYFDSVQGLNRGAVVSLAGVKVGNIEEIKFDSNRNLVEVTSRIEAEFKPTIKKDSRIEIRTQGALGDKYLYITPGSPASESISNGDEISSDYGNDILSVFQKRGNESEKIFDILNDLKVITKSLAQNNRLPYVVANLEKASANLANLNVASINNSSAKLENIMNKVNNGEGTLGALINDRSIHERIKSILGAGQKDQQVKSILKSSIDE
jgi:phospholipid/cholesterol/gamma-HCH transport system substrate-binding protein